MNRIAKERVIFQNYDLDNYEEEYKAEYADEDGEINENAMWDWIYDSLDIEFEIIFDELCHFFNNQIIAFGSVGRWDGVYTGGNVFNNFKEAFYSLTKDCDYIKIYDENGHLYIHCSHHDGSCSYELKELTTAGEEYYDRWNYGCDNRTAKQCHNQIIKRYSKLPNFVNKYYGCPKVEYIKKPTKEDYKRKLNNVAVSFYS